MCCARDPAGSSSELECGSAVPPAAGAAALLHTGHVCVPDIIAAPGAARLSAAAPLLLLQLPHTAVCASRPCASRPFAAAVQLLHEEKAKAKAAQADIDTAWTEYLARFGGLAFLPCAASMVTLREAALRSAFRTNVARMVADNEGPNGAMHDGERHHQVLRHVAGAV